MPDTQSHAIERNKKNAIAAIDGRAVERFECNGCGSFWCAYLIMDNLPFLPMRPLCCEHDFEYWRGGTEADRLRADTDFYLGILSFQNGHCAPVRCYIRWVASVRYAAVRCFGGHGSFVFTRNGLPREPVVIDGAFYFFRDEVA